MKMAFTPLRNAELESLGYVSNHQRTVIGDPWNEDFDPLADTLPPTPAKELLRVEGVEIYVLSSDLEFLAPLRQATGERFPLTQTASFNELLRAVRAGRCSIAILDADPVSEALKEQLSQLCDTVHPLVLMLATSAAHVDDLDEHLAAVAGEPLLVKPCSPDFLRMRLTWALGRYFQLKQQPAPAIDAPPPQAIIPARRPWLSGAAIALSAIAIAAVLIAWIKGGFEFDPPDLAIVSTGIGVPENPRPGSSNDPVIISGESDTSGEQAPPPSLVAASAADTATNPMPAVDTKRDALQRAAQEAFGSDTAEAAQKLGALIELIEDLDAETLDQLPSLLEQEKQRNAARVASETAAKPASAQLPTQPETPELDPTLALVSARLAEGRLVEPLEDSAIAYFSRAEKIAPGDQRLNQVRNQLIDGLRLAAYASLDVGDLNATELLLNQATAAGATAELLGDLETELSAARREKDRQAVLLNQVQNLLEAGQLLRPPENNAWSALESVRANSPNDPDVLAAVIQFRSALAESVEYMLTDADWSAAAEALAILSELNLDERRLLAFDTALTFGQRQAALLATSAPLTELALVTFEQPEYPRKAVRRGIEGWVELSFVVNEQGVPEAINVTAAEPADVFEDAVLAAVTDYRFEPHRVDGQIYRRAAHTRVSFKLIP